MYSMGNIVVTFYQLCKVIGGIQTHCGDHFLMYVNAES